MANSYVEYTTSEHGTGTGTNALGQTTFTAPTKFISINDIRAKGYNGSTWTELTISQRGTNTVTLSATPTSGSYSKVRIYRATTSDQLVDFQSGAVLSESDLDTAYNQGLFVAQEVSEDAGAVGTLVNNNQTLNGTTTVDNLTATGTVTLPNGAISNDNLAGSIPSSKLAGGIDITTQVTGYAEGSYTATITPLTSGSITLQSGKNTGYYTKIGNMVQVVGTLWVASTSSPQGSVAISLPFPVVNNVYKVSIGDTTLHGVTYQSNQKGSFKVLANANTSYATLYYNTTSSMLSLQAQNAGLAANSQFRFALNYFTS